MADPSHGLAQLDGGPSRMKASIWAIIQEGLEKDPNKTAVIAMHQKPDHLAGLVGWRPGQNDKHLAWTYEQMRLGSSRLASILTAAGVKAGSVLVTIVPNCAECCLFSWTAALMELTLIPLDSRIVEPARREELMYYLETLKPVAIVVNDQHGVSAVDAARSELGISSKFSGCLGSDEELNSAWTTFDEIASRHFTATQDNMTVSESGDPNRVHTVIFTSGTSSGTPKGCPHTVTSLGNSIANDAGMWGMTSTSLPIVHFTNFRIIHTIITLAHWQTGATIILPAPTSASATTLTAIEIHQATSLLCMPAMVHAIAEDPSYSHQRIRSLTQVSVGGDVTTMTLLRKIRQVFPGTHVYNQHGMIEGSGILSWPSTMDFHSDTPSHQGIVAVGHVLPGNKIRILATDNLPHRILRKGEIGELHIAGSSVCTRYLGDQHPELFYLDDDDESWFVTGDRGMIDNDDWVYILGRSKDIMKRNGVPIAAAGLEACLNEYTNTQVSTLLHRFTTVMPH